MNGSTGDRRSLTIMSLEGNCSEHPGGQQNDNEDHFQKNMDISKQEGKYARQ